MGVREDLKNFIVKKVKENVSEDRPFFFVKWSGLYELCKSYQVDLLELIDELCAEGKLKKALINKKLALTLPELNISKKAKSIIKEFEKFRSQ